jgi:Protein of unknown function (DUF3309)
VHEAGQAPEAAAIGKPGTRRHAQMQNLLSDVHIRLREEAGRGGARRPRTMDLPNVKRRQTCMDKLRRETGRRKKMLLILLLVVLLLAVTPRWPYSRRWGYYPSGGLGVVLVVVIALVLMGNLRL